MEVNKEPTGKLVIKLCKQKWAAFNIIVPISYFDYKKIDRKLDIIEKTKSIDFD